MAVNLGGLIKSTKEDYPSGCHQFDICALFLKNELRFSNSTSLYISFLVQKVPQRNQFANVTRWFNHLQPLFEPYFPSVAIKLSYTAPKVRFYNRNIKQSIYIYFLLIQKPEKGKGKGKGDDKPKKGNQGQRRAPEEKITGFARLRLQVGKIVSIEVHSSVPR